MRQTISDFFLMVREFINYIVLWVKTKAMRLLERLIVPVWPLF
jgi:hypothetical protein